MIRTLFLLLIAASLTARASDPISAPAQGASATVSQTHVTAELIPETTNVQPGQPFDVALHLHADPGWHTYWINPGDAGLATTIAWTLPPGFTAGPIQWPTPEKHSMGPEMTYGYGGDVYLLTTITPPKADLPQHFEVKARATWLVCQEECIPGKADLTVPLDSGLLNLRLPVENKELFTQARERLPVANTRWEVKAAYEHVGLGQALVLQFRNLAEASNGIIGHAYFFPEQGNVLSATQNLTSQPTTDKKETEFALVLPLEQNGDKLDKLSGVLVSDQPLIGAAKAVYIPAFSTDAKDIPVNSASLASPPVQSTQTSTSTQDTTFRHPELVEGSVQSHSVAAAVPGGGSTPPSGGPAMTGVPVLSGSPQATGSSEQTATQGNTDDGHRPPLQAEQPLLVIVLGAAFIGGLILNLMPCVLPVLSLKVFSLIKHAGENPRGAWKQGVAFAAGVLLSFWILAGLLLVLGTAGNRLGWGFQMQSPGFVLALIFLFFLLALNLFGVFEFGASLTGLDARATGRFHGTPSSFFNGALATLAATPCTAPFMGSALGFAAQQPPFVALLIFTFLALGMATPYLLLTIFPGALRFVPKPGAWMEALKQFMGFLLLATVIFLVYVFGALKGNGLISLVLFTLLLIGLASWIYGRWVNPSQPRSYRLVGLFMVVSLWIAIVGSAIGLVEARVPHSVAAEEHATDGWQPWTQGAVDEALAQGRPVFVDFTAAWCLSCKVNEAVALDTDAVRQAFAQKNVALFRADWTHADPDISETLRRYNRDGVPLYLLYSPKAREAPQVLPAVLTPGIVLDALAKE